MQIYAFSNTNIFRNLIRDIDLMTFTVGQQVFQNFAKKIEQIMLQIVERIKLENEKSRVSFFLPTSNQEKYTKLDRFEMVINFRILQSVQLIFKKFPPYFSNFSIDLITVYKHNEVQRRYLLKTIIMGYFCFRIVCADKNNLISTKLYHQFEINMTSNF